MQCVTQYMEDHEIASAIIEQSQNAFELLKLLDHQHRSEVIELLQENLAELEG